MIKRKLRHLAARTLRRKVGRSVVDRIERGADEFLGLDALEGQPSRVVARRLLRRIVAIAGGVSFLPGSALILTSLELALLIQVARVYGIPASQLNKELLFTQLGIRYGVTTAASFAAESFQVLPVVGNVAKGVVGGSAVYVLGRAMIRYFEAAAPDTRYSRAGIGPGLQSSRARGEVV